VSKISQQVADVEDVEWTTHDSEAKGEAESTDCNGNSEPNGYEPRNISALKKFMD